MAHSTWIGTVDGDFATAGNWDGAVPVGGGSWTCNHRAVRNLDASDQSGLTFAQVILSSGFAYSIGTGAGANSLKCDITKLRTSSRGQECWFTGAVTEVIARNMSTGPDALVIDGAVTRLQLQGGVMRMHDGTAPASSRWTVDAFDGSVSELTVLVACDLATNNTAVRVKGGTLYLEDTCDDLIQTGGICNLQDSAPSIVGAVLPNTFEVHGGVCNWIGKGTITAGHIYGGLFTVPAALPDVADGADVPKTLTNLTMYNDAVVDLQTGNNITFSNALRALGDNVPLYPPGHTTTVAA